MFNKNIDYNILKLNLQTENYNFGTQNSIPEGIYIREDGKKLYMVGAATNKYVYQYSFGTDYNIKELSYDNKYYNVSSQTSAPKSIFFNNTGTIMYILGESDDKIYQYNLGTAWDVSTANFTNKVLNMSTQSSNMLYFVFNMMVMLYIL
jgi:hypothetical protein